MSRIGSKELFAAAVLALGLFPLLAPLPVYADTLKCIPSDFSGAFASPVGLFGDWSLSNVLLSTPTQLGPLAQGTLAAIFTSSLPLGVSGDVVTGSWSFNTATGKLLMKVQGSFYLIDFAYLNLPGQGFTFQGVLHIVGQMPLPMAQTPPISLPITC